MADASDSGAGEHVCDWDWENLLREDIAVNDDAAAAAGPVPAEAARAAERDPAPPQPTQARGSRRGARKRQPPGLSCPNNLAGITPCACPEADAAAEAPPGRRRKPGMAARAARRAAEMRCQVPGCEADIQELKGYHRRHRVCLRCAHAAAVLLDGARKRYCQQCGSFHVLLDFDGDKRSCRRKLERHNNRRRGKPNSKRRSEKEAVQQLDSSAGASSDGGREDSNEKGNIDGTACDMLETVISNKDSESETLLGSEGFLNPPTCAQRTLQTDELTIAAYVDSCRGPKQGSTEHTNSPMHDNDSAYLSSCPTGRISFKLHDWNPAEFPRRLRHQIFEWLSRMPVELEGYVRPGCTILTAFIAMPQDMWNKLSEDAASLVNNLVNAPNSVLLGKGAFSVHVNHMIFKVLKDGATFISTRLDAQAPKIHYVYPAWFEAGKPVEFFLCGSSLDQPKFRSLLSFDGEYLEHDWCRLRSHETTSPILESQHEFFRTSITQSKATHGPAFVEVENMSGLSNFVPIIFGSKQLCFELYKIHEALCGSPWKCKNVFRDFRCSTCQHRNLQQTAMTCFLIDIGWLIRKPSSGEFKNILCLTNIKRWICVLKFLTQNNFVNVLEIIVESLDDFIHSKILPPSLNRAKLEDHIIEFLGYISLARDVVDRRAYREEKAQLHTRWCSDSAPSRQKLGTTMSLSK